MLDIVKTEKGEPATIAELAVINFSGHAELKGLADKELAEVSKRRADQFYNLSYLALAQMRMSKDELVASIRKNQDSEVWSSLLEMLSDGQDVARTLLQFLASAEARLLVAMATAAQEERPGDPDGGEEIPLRSVAS